MNILPFIFLIFVILAPNGNLSLTPAAENDIITNLPGLDFPMTRMFSGYLAINNVSTYIQFNYNAHTITKYIIVYV